MNNEDEYIWRQIKRGYFPQIEIIDINNTQPVKHQKYNMVGETISVKLYQTNIRCITLEELLIGSPHSKIYIQPSSEETPYFENERVVHDSITFESRIVKELFLRVIIIPLELSQLKLQGYRHYEPKKLELTKEKSKKYLLLVR